MFANKATGHELQGLQHLMYFVFKEGVAGLHFPLMCVADFMGHRISVQVRNLCVLLWCLFVSLK